MIISILNRWDISNILEMRGPDPILEQEAATYNFVLA